MFNNTVPLWDVVTANQATAISVVDTDNGRTMRRKNLGNGHFVRQTISSTTSNENSPILTDRFLLRVDKELPDPVTHKPIVGSAYLVTGVPRSVQFTKSDIIQCVQGLIEFLLNPDADPANVAASLTVDQRAAIATTLNRIFDGES